MYCFQKVRPKNLTFWKSVFLCQNTHENEHQDMFIFNSLDNC